MMRRIIPCLYVLLLALFVASCSSTKSMKKVGSIEGMTDAEYVENVIAHAPSWEAMTAKMALGINLDGKGTTKVNGTLRIKKGEVIQMSIAPLLGIEVARAEISPDGVLVIDRMNKRYVRVSFAELGGLVKADLDFHTLQALFLNELFLPGKEKLVSRDVSSFEVTMQQPDVLLDVKKTKRFAYRFLTEAPDGLLKQSNISLQGTSYSLEWKYDNFRTLEQKPFPTSMEVFFMGTKQPAKATFNLSRLSVNSDWETHTQVSEKYERVELEDLIKILLKK